MSPEQRETILKSLIEVLETKLTEANGGRRCNFALVILEDDPGGRPSYISHLTNSPRELVMAMLKAVYERPYTGG